jgi:hypothetical protein
MSLKDIIFYTTLQSNIAPQLLTVSMNLSTLMDASGSVSNRKLSSKKDSNKKLSRQKEQLFCYDERSLV